MMIALVDQGDVHRRPGHILDQFEPAESGANDHKMVLLRCSHCPDIGSSPGRANNFGGYAISGFIPIAVRSTISRSAKDELILVTCGMADSHSLWIRS